ncbi:MAG: hypothetical protein KDA33_05445 [Phycisphaerales bacterium]|nr:hypothetical protein [Phycisphaerales bacterium]
MAIATGAAVNLHIIQATQVAEGYEPCFGRADAECGQVECAYHTTCMSLIRFEQKANRGGFVLGKPRTMSADTITHKDFSRPQLVHPAADSAFDTVESR